MPRPARKKVGVPSRVTAKNDIATQPPAQTAKGSKTQESARKQDSTRRTSGRARKPTLKTRDSTGSSDQDRMTGALPAKAPIEIGSSSSSLSTSSSESGERRSRVQTSQTRISRSKPAVVATRTEKPSKSTAATTVQTVKSSQVRVSKSSSSKVSSPAALVAKSIRTSTSRAQTPARKEPLQSAVESSDDLYAVSPGGKAARTVQQSQMTASRRTSLLQPASLLKAFGTPAGESSVLALNRFKRRKRQGSIIRLMQEASGLDTDLENDINLDDTNFGLGEFSPENESTPVHAATSKHAEPQSTQSRTSSSRKRKFRESEVQVPQSSSSSALSPAPDSDDDLPEASAAEIIPATQDPESDTMAPPLSSSILSEGLSPVSSPAKRQRRRGPEISTLHLQSLLPRTRRVNHTTRSAARDTFDAPSTEDTFDAEPESSSSSSSSSESEAEPEQEPTPPRRTRGQPRKATQRKPLQPASRNAKAPSKKSTTTIKAGAKGKGKAKYQSRKTAGVADKENEEDETIAFEESTLLEDKRREREMESVRSKFAAVDEWEMEFEVVDYSGGSSPWR